MIKVAVCDDEESVRYKLKEYINDFFKEKNQSAVVNDYESGSQLISDKEQYDVIFLDIEMPELNGIQTVQQLRKYDTKSKIIYVTNYENYSRQAYKVHAFDYISKPVSKESIYNVLSELMRYMKDGSKPKQYAFNTENGIVSLYLDEIYYFEYLSRKAYIHSKNGVFKSRYTLGELYDKFTEKGFQASHQSFIVNMSHISFIRGYDIFLDNEEKIPLAQKKAVEFKKQFNDFLQGTFNQV